MDVWGVEIVVVGGIGNGTKKKAAETPVSRCKRRRRKEKAVVQAMFERRAGVLFKRGVWRWIGQGRGRVVLPTSPSPRPAASQPILTVERETRRRATWATSLTASRRAA